MKGEKKGKEVEGVKKTGEEVSEEKVGDKVVKISTDGEGS